MLISFSSATKLHEIYVPIITRSPCTVRLKVSKNKEGWREAVHGWYGCVNLVSIENQVVKQSMQGEHPLGKFNDISTSFCPKLRI